MTKWKLLVTVTTRPDMARGFDVKMPKVVKFQGVDDKGIKMDRPWMAEKSMWSRNVTMHPMSVGQGVC